MQLKLGALNHSRFSVLTRISIRLNRLIQKTAAVLDVGKIGRLEDMLYNGVGAYRLWFRLFFHNTQWSVI